MQEGLQILALFGISDRHVNIFLILEAEILNRNHNLNLTYEILMATV